MNEQSFIGCLLLDPELVEKSTLEPQMFESPALGRIFYELTQGNDATLLATKYKDDPIMTYNLQQCLDSIPPTSLYVTQYEKEIRNEWRKREIDKILGSMVFQSGSIEEQLEDLREKVEQLQTETEDTGHTIGELVELYSKRQYVEKERIGTGFRRIDTACGGLDRGDVTVIGARPSVGKSAFSAQVAKNLHKNGFKVVIFNLEMEEEQIYQRFLAAEGLFLDRIRNASSFVSESEENLFNSANERLRKNDIMVHTGRKTVRDIRNLSKGYDVVIVDYLQLVKCRDTYRGNRNQEVAEVSWDLRSMAHDFHCVVILLSQLNRESERHKDITLADLRDSGAIEQDASVVMLLDKTKKGLRKLSVEKNRNGSGGHVYLEFDGPRMRFIETDKTDRDVKEEEKWEKISKNPFSESK